MSIPKKIHYCWLSGERMPNDIIVSINSWKRTMPDYELVLWDKNKFDINSVPWVAEAYSVRKFALAADYIRLFAVYTEGGIYLDSDVYVLKPFDDLLQYDYFTGIEHESKTSIFENVINSDLEDIQRVGDITLEAGIFGGIKGHPYLKDCMTWYENRHYLLPNGKLSERVVAPEIYAAVAQKYGFKYKSALQKINNNMIIFSPGTFANPTINPNKQSYAVHWWIGSWRKKPLSLFDKIKMNSVVRKLFWKKPIPSLEERIQESIVQS